MIIQQTSAISSRKFGFLADRLQTWSHHQDSLSSFDLLYRTDMKEEIK